MVLVSNFGVRWTSNRRFGEAVKGTKSCGVGRIGSTIKVTSAEKEAQNSSSVRTSGKPYQAPYARLSSLKDPCTANPENGKTPSTRIETETMGVKAQVSGFEDLKLAMIPESLAKVQVKESLKGFKRLLMLAKKNHSLVACEHSVESDNASVDGSELDGNVTNAASSTEERGVDICFPTPLKENRDTQSRREQRHGEPDRKAFGAGIWGLLFGCSGSVGARPRLWELVFGVYSLVVPVPLVRGGMVVSVPFRRWVHVKHRNPQTRHGGFYCLLPIRGQRVIAAVARYRHGGQLEYKAYSVFVREYRDVLGLGDNLIWAARDDLVKWLDALMHNSFVHYSTPVRTLRNQISQDEEATSQNASDCYSASTSRLVLFFYLDFLPLVTASRNFSLLSPFHSKTSEKKLTSS